MTAGAVLIRCRVVWAWRGSGMLVSDSVNMRASDNPSSTDVSGRPVGVMLQGTGAWEVGSGGLPLVMILVW